MAQLLITTKNDDFRFDVHDDDAIYDCLMDLTNDFTLAEYIPEWVTIMDIGDEYDSGIPGLSIQIVDTEE